MAIDTYLKNNKRIENIIFCFDNDFDKVENYGQDKAKEFGRIYKEQGYNCYLHKPTNKDFNEDLVEKVNNIKIDKEKDDYDMDR